MRFLMLIIFSVLSYKAMASGLEIVDKQEVKLVSIEEIRGSAAYSVESYGPFRKKVVRFQGHDLHEFLTRAVGHEVSKIQLSAQDGYEVTLDSLKAQDWVLVTHEDGEPLTLRSHGPLRIIQPDLKGRDPENLSLYDDWIWMIRRIVVVD